MSETEVDGNTPALFFFQAVRVNARQGPNQGSLAVVDVARGADDYILHALLLMLLPRGATFPKKREERKGDRWCATQE